MKERAAMVMCVSLAMGNGGASYKYLLDSFLSLVCLFVFMTEKSLNWAQCSDRFRSLRSDSKQYRCHIRLF